MYILIGYYQGKSERIDQADTYDQAEYLRREYRLAFGPAWSIQIQKTNDDDE